MISHILYNIKPDEIYHLVAQSHIRVSFEISECTGNVTDLGTTRLLEAIRRSNPDVRFYQASSCEMFGHIAPPQNEESIWLVLKCIHTGWLGITTTDMVCFM